MRNIASKNIEHMFCIQNNTDKLRLQEITDTRLDIAHMYFVR